jgi:formate/nitrite transporter
MDGSQKVAVREPDLSPVITPGNGIPAAVAAEPIRTISIDSVRPAELVADVVAAAGVKARLSITDMLIRGFLAGAFLGFATILAFTVRSQGLPTIVDALIFPAGFVLLALLGLELVTGNFAILPVGVAAKKVPMTGLLRNWTWVFIANLVGCLFFAVLAFIVLTNFGTTDGGPVAEIIRKATVAKTATYSDLGGASGWMLAFIKGVLANWMVTVGAMMLFVSRSTTGKVVTMWLPIMIFFALGYEHSVVNMFVLPAGIMLGAPVTVGDWWIWNQIPVTLGNIAAGAVLTGLALHLTYKPKKVTP